ncbi:variable surface protein [Plasmodium gonderi]|uniref:Variable surface protein n=1 Tax=Plasmodium gonderi TaxID=77519 RepID=A0A1Y1JRU1_PLAGO|nr:variable surface protein [Plasmodium gonderi]GAW84178.1 variable surface protein [Plasmodium gonderi]
MPYIYALYYAFKIHGYVNLFSHFKNFTVNEREQGDEILSDLCKNSEINILNDIKSDFCNMRLKSLNYIKYAKTQRHYNPILEEAICVYLYYLIYHNEGVENNNEYIKKLYDRFIQVNNNNFDYICQDHKDFIITDGEILKLNDINDIYTNLNNIKYSGETCSEDKCNYAKKIY